MATTTTEHDVQSINVVKEIEIAASVEDTFEAMLEELGPASMMPDGTAMPMVIEPWPGGRWFRDLGNKSGHLWGHVQVIKPPALLELCGPLFMSFPGVNHLQYRLTAEGNGTRLKLTHRGIGQLPPEMGERVGEGWAFKIGRIREIAESRGKGSSGNKK
jgi:uncharacterized protein YndB with AHSA1/START domain